METAQRLVELAETASGSLGRELSLNEMVLWNLVVMGEAAKRLREPIKMRFPDIAWASMMRTRDRIIHHYEGVDWEIVQRIIEIDLPPLIPRLVEIRDTVRAEFDAAEAAADP